MVGGYRQLANRGVGRDFTLRCLCRRDRRELPAIRRDQADQLTPTLRSLIDLQPIDDHLRRPTRTDSTCSINSGSGTAASDSISISACPIGRRLVSEFGTATQKIPAAWAAVIPFGESSRTIASSGFSP